MKTARSLRLVAAGAIIAFAITAHLVPEPPGDLGWFITMPAGLLTAIYANGQRTDLVTIPPQTSEQDAAAAMEQAARPGNREHAPAILAAIAVAAGSTTREDAESKQLGTWEWEGGHLRDHEATPDRSRPVSAGHAPSPPAAGPGSS